MNLKKAVIAGAMATGVLLSGCLHNESSEPDPVAIPDSSAFPVFTSPNVFAGSEGELLTFFVQAFPRWDTLRINPITVTGSGLPAGASLNVNSFSWLPDYTSAGDHQLSFTAVSDTFSNTQQVTITIHDVAVEVPTLVFASDSVINTGEGLFVDFAVTAGLSTSDTLIEDSVIITASPLPTGATFASSRLNWWPDYMSAGTHQVVFTAAYGTDSLTQTVTIIVKDSLVSYLNQVQPIFTGQCIECHNPEAEGYTQTGADANGLDLRPDSSWASMVNMITFQLPDFSPTYRVLPGDTAESYLLQKVDVNQTQKFGEIMPLGGFGGFVEPYNIAIIKAWILEGALDN